MAEKYKVVGLGKLGAAGMELETKELDQVGADIEVVEARCRSEEELINA